MDLNGWEARLLDPTYRVEEITRARLMAGSCETAKRSWGKMSDDLARRWAEKAAFGSPEQEYRHAHALYCFVRHSGGLMIAETLLRVALDRPERWAKVGPRERLLVVRLLAEDWQLVPSGDFLSLLQQECGNPNRDSRALLEPLLAGLIAWGLEEALPALSLPSLAHPLHSSAALAAFRGAWRETFAFEKPLLSDAVLRAELELSATAEKGGDPALHEWSAYRVMLAEWRREIEILTEETNEARSEKGLIERAAGMLSGGKEEK